jgi:DNA topoisomerase-1
MMAKKCMLEINLIGKDSVPYHQIIEIDSYASKALAALLATTKKSDRIFPDADNVNALIKECVPGISAKTFRTAKGTMTLVEQLKAHPVSKTDSLIAKERALFEASLTTSQLLNHQRNVGKNFKEQSEKTASRVTTAEETLKAKKAAAALAVKKLSKDAATAKQLWKGDKLKAKLEAIALKKDRLSSQIARCEERLEKATLNQDVKTRSAETALGTARSAYCSPLVLYSWAKDVEYPIEKVYTKSLITRMQWAEKTPASYWKRFPNV